jgi:two-component system response regulator (stage 0 sporulation protein A)
MMSQAVPAPRPKKLRIVLVDDEKYMLQLLETYLREWFDDLDLLPFQNGDTAWQALAQIVPDLLITDWRHPGLDGGELLRKLAEQPVRPPVLMITAYDNDCVQEFAGSRLTINFLQKPFGVAQFWNAINSLVGPCDHPPIIPKSLK